MRTYGLDEAWGIHLLMGHTPEHLATSWERSKLCVQEGGTLGVEVTSLSG